MKRKREVEKGSEMRSAIEELSLMIKLKPKNAKENDDVSDADDHHLPIMPFLHFCNLIVQVLDKIGPTMFVLRQDIHQNIQRLEKLCELDSLLYSNMAEILKKEANEGNARKRTSCSKAILWLARSVDFTVDLLQRLMKDPEEKMEQAVEESYNLTLKPWHGWISSAAFKVALKLVPDRTTFTNLLLKKDETYDILEEDMQTLISLLTPYLEAIHSILRVHDLDTLKST